MTVNDFMDTMMSDPGPACLVWLPLLHRLAAVENGKFLHPLPIGLISDFSVMITLSSVFAQLSIRSSVTPVIEKISPGFGIVVKNATISKCVKNASGVVD